VTIIIPQLLQLLERNTTRNGCGRCGPFPPSATLAITTATTITAGSSNVVSTRPHSSSQIKATRSDDTCHARWCTSILCIMYTIRISCSYSRVGPLAGELKSVTARTLRVDFITLDSFFAAGCIIRTPKLDRSLIGMNNVLKQPDFERVYPGLCLRGGGIDVILRSSIYTRVRDWYFRF